MNYYQILNVSRMVSASEIKREYFKLTRKYHPDLFDINLSSEKKEKIVSLFDNIVKAYRTLSSENAKNKYDSEISDIQKGKRADNIKKAETKFQQAKLLYDEKKYNEARLLLKEAISLKRDIGKYYLLIAMAESKNPDFHKRAEENFKRAMERDPWNAEAYIGLGLLYKEAGLMVKAARQFKSALDVNPDHPIALKELDISRKPEKKRSLKDIFSLIFFDRK
jgi:curved DNA-binding protein CbpA